MTVQDAEPAELPLRFSRNARLNAITIAMTVVPAIFMTSAAFLVTGIPLWLRAGGPLVGSLLIWQLRLLFRNWDLSVEVHPCELLWSVRGTKHRLDLHDVRELYIDEPRNYRVVLGDGSVERLDFRVLYHALGQLDRQISELTTGHVLARLVRGLAAGHEQTFGPICLVRNSDGVLVCLGNLHVPVADADFVPGNIIATLANARTKHVRTAPMKAVPNVQALAVAIHLLKHHPLDAVVEGMLGPAPRV